jgi:hypothetical protein
MAQATMAKHEIISRDLRGEIAAGDPDEKQNVLSSKPVDVLKNPNE